MEESGNMKKVGGEEGGTGTEAWASMIWHRVLSEAGGQLVQTP